MNGVCLFLGKGWVKEDYKCITYIDNLLFCFYSSHPFSTSAFFNILSLIISFKYMGLSTLKSSKRSKSREQEDLV